MRYNILMGGGVASAKANPTASNFKFSSIPVGLASADAKQNWNYYEI